MHTNEIHITKDNMESLMKEAESLGPQFIAALKEQVERQVGKTK